MIDCIADCGRPAEENTYPYCNDCEGYLTEGQLEDLAVQIERVHNGEVLVL